MLRKARERASGELERITETINRLLDSISPENRDVIDPRLKTLNEQRQTLEARLDELDRLTASQTEIRTVVSDTMRFLAALPFTLREGVPQEKLGVLRQCVERVRIGQCLRKASAFLFTIPLGGRSDSQLLIFSFV